MSMTLSGSLFEVTDHHGQRWEAAVSDGMVRVQKPRGRFRRPPGGVVTQTLPDAIAFLALGQQIDKERLDDQIVVRLNVVRLNDIPCDLLLCTPSSSGAAPWVVELATRRLIGSAQATATYEVAQPIAHAVEPNAWGKCRELRLAGKEHWLIEPFPDETRPLMHSAHRPREYVDRVDVGLDAGEVRLFKAALEARLEDERSDATTFVTPWLEDFIRRVDEASKNGRASLSEGDIALMNESIHAYARTVIAPPDKRTLEGWTDCPEADAAIAVAEQLDRRIRDRVQAERRLRG
jgi:hypothetical protein